MDCVNRGRDYIRVGGRRGLFPRLELQKGGYAGSRRRIVIGLDHQLGPTHKKCGRASYSDVQQGFDLLWVQVTTSAECTEVSGYSLFWEGAANMAGKEPIKALINL
jgi:hypothetical protein